MKAAISLFFILLFAPVWAETLNNIEYQIPKNWKVCDKLEGKSGTTLIYVPESAQKEQEREFFGITVMSLTTDVKDVKSLEEGFQKHFPNREVVVKVLSQNEDSLLYQWSVADKGQEVVHGWGRAIAMPEGSAVLSYQTQNISDLKNAEGTWLPILKDVKISKS